MSIVVESGFIGVLLFVGMVTGGGVGRVDIQFPFC